MALVDIVRRAWAFTGLVPRSIIDINAFGNLLVEDVGGRVWRICPEELSCEVVAPTVPSLEQLRASPDFQRDWAMQELVERATTTLGPPGEGRCFCLKLPGVLGGEYASTNLATISLSELIEFAGEMARQIEDVPDGGKVRIRFVHTVTLYRPVGPKELVLIEASGWSAFPPRLPDQPIFYPVLNEAYAMRIARDWNVKESGAGFVTRFAVDAEFVRRYPEQVVGDSTHRELWVPAEELAEFNRHIVGRIEVIAEFRSTDA